MRTELRSIKIGAIKIYVTHRSNKDSTTFTFGKATTEEVDGSGG
jgi:hypothetical protein